MADWLQSTYFTQQQLDFSTTTKIIELASLSLTNFKGLEFQLSYRKRTALATTEFHRLHQDLTARENTQLPSEIKRMVCHLILLQQNQVTSAKRQYFPDAKKGQIKGSSLDEGDGVFAWLPFALLHRPLKARGSLLTEPYDQYSNVLNVHGV